MTKRAKQKFPAVDALVRAETGRLASPLATAKCVPPEHLELVDDRLIYTPVVTPRYLVGDVGRDPNSEMLLGFAGLADAEPQKIFAFAKKWGVLGVCMHDMSLSHLPSPGCLPRVAEESASPGRPRAGMLRLTGTFWEPISLWRSRATSCRILLETASACRRAARIDNALTGGHRKMREAMSIGDGIQDALEWQRLVATIELNQRMSTAGVTPALTVTEIGADFWLNYDGLDGAIAATLFSAIAGQGFGMCSHCGQVYEPEKRPRDGEQQWCSRCRTKGHSLAAASKAHRDRKKRAFELQAQGKSVTEIAAALGRPEGTVSKWFESAGAGGTRRKSK